MFFYSVRDLRTTPKIIWEQLSEDGEVVITNNGKPMALMLDIAEGNFDETIRAIRQARAMIAFNSMRKKSAEKGYFSDEDINAEIKSARLER